MAPRRPAKDDRTVEAVYAHIQAIRALGRTSVNTLEIAEALNLPTKKVSDAVKALGPRGVRPKK
jgi:hypothetical protein